MTYTKGPWEVTRNNDVMCEDGMGICALWCEGEEKKANAHLIAAAPELYEALKALLNKAYKQNWNDHYPEQVEEAEQAIAKARCEK